MYYDHRLYCCIPFKPNEPTKIEPKPGKSHIDEEHDTADNDKKDDLRLG